MLLCVQPKFNSLWSSCQQVSLSPRAARHNQRSILPRLVNEYWIILGLALGHQWWGLFPSSTTHGMTAKNLQSWVVRLHPYQLSWWYLGSGMHSLVTESLYLRNKIMINHAIIADNNKYFLHWPKMLDYVLFVLFPITNPDLYFLMLLRLSNPINIL